AAETAGFDALVDLPLDLVVCRPLEHAAAVEILDLGDGGPVHLAGGVGDVDVDVRLEAHVAHLHLGLADAEKPDDLLQFLPDRTPFLTARQTRPDDALPQPRTGAVAIANAVSDRIPAPAFVQQLAGILLKMRPADA